MRITENNMGLFLRGLEWVGKRFKFSQPFAFGREVTAEAKLSVGTTINMHLHTSLPDAADAAYGPNCMILYDDGVTRKLLISDDAYDWRVFATEGAIEIG